MAKDKLIARIIYNPDGSIRAEHLPGIVNFTYWLAKKIDSGRWRQTGEGLWLYCTVSPEEAEYVRRLAIAQKDDDESACEIVGLPASVDGEKFAESRKLVERYERVFNGKDSVDRNKDDCDKAVSKTTKSIDGGEEYGQLSLFG
jgi:hypothetical protein